MKFVDEYRDARGADRYREMINSLVTRPWSIMEICGGQTHSIVRYGIDQLLPADVTLIHGPGCPVCVTPIAMIDRAIELAMRPQIILASFGDMARVPGSDGSLLSAKARGADLRLLYSPLDAVALAQANPQREVVFFAVGFETTAPATAMAVFQAKKLGLTNFSMLVAHVLVPPAMRAILDATDCRVDGFLAAGHVCSVMGYQDYHPIARQFGVPIVVTGFEPNDILQGLAMCLQQLEAGQALVENQYARAVTAAGNQTAQELMRQVFVTESREWRGIGPIENSGLGLSPDYADFDAARRFDLQSPAVAGSGERSCGEVLRGLLKPAQCPHFGKRCTPAHPLGAPMVSSEGACAAYVRHRVLPLSH